MTRAKGAPKDMLVALCFITENVQGNVQETWEGLPVRKSMRLEMYKRA